MTELDALDRSLLERLQAQFPLVPRPYAALAQAMHLDEAQVLARIQRLKADGMIREISAIFDTRRLGYQTTLVAFHVASGDLEQVAAQISANPGVSHNYARPHYYNLWFTLAVPSGRSLVTAIERMAAEAGVDDWLNLPALRVFKIRTHFKIQNGSVSRTPDETDDPAGDPAGDSTRTASKFVPADIPFVRELQKDLELVPQPYAQAACRLDLNEEELLTKAREMEAVGIMRRFGAVLRHRRVGYTANGMACWAAPHSLIERAGMRAAEFPQVSHCYERPACPPGWPYSLFTMIHGQTVDEVKAIVTQLAQETRIEQYEVLYSTREFKKERVRYFEEEA